MLLRATHHLGWVLLGLVRVHWPLATGRSWLSSLSSNKYCWTPSSHSRAGAPLGLYIHISRCFPCNSKLEPRVWSCRSTPCVLCRTAPGVFFGRRASRCV